jgi:hypothetical protein
MNDQLSNQTSANTFTYDDPDFISLDDPNLKWPMFPLAMLKIARIKTAKEALRQDISAGQISRWMYRHRNEMPMLYSGREIRELFGNYGCYLSGGGVRIEAHELSQRTYRTLPQYSFTFTKIYKPEPQNEAKHEPART